MALPNESDTLKAGVEPRDEVEVYIKAEPEVELEVIDDTPKEDRGRKPLPPEDMAPTEEELEQYSESVQKRIRKETHRFHDARRSKETAERERDEAISTAQRLFSEKKALEARYVLGENAFINQAQQKTELAMANAKRAYKEAYEIGDAEAMADAQENIAGIAAERKEAEAWSRRAAERAQTARQEEAPVVQRRQSPQAAPPEVEPEAQDWALKNKWFGQNKVMTGAAYGVHDELIELGIDPVIDKREYYQKLNARLREEFPSYEWGDAPPKKKSTSVVAPVNRTSKTTTRVTLTQSQLAVAKRMGLTPLQYAVEVAKLEN
jgi:hypothetical protein